MDLCTSILLVINDVSTNVFLSELFMSENYDIGHAGSMDEAFIKVEKGNWDVILLDLFTSGETGLECLRKIKEINSCVPVVVISDYALELSAMESVKELGSSAYLIKPFENDDLLEIITQSLASSDLITSKMGKQKKKLSYKSGSEKHGKVSPNIIGNSTAMNKALEMVAKVANRDTTVLLTGESGTGKSLIAKELHNLSARKEFPFITINCAVLPETLLESELFGHEKGAFTGASSTKIGKFEFADKGTIFLDEIGTLSLQTQAKLLRVLQENAYERLGGLKTFISDVRIIAATNENLNEAIESGRFRKDLYYRLYVFGIRVPSLKERTEDIQELVEYFITRFNKKFSLKVQGLTSTALTTLKGYPWPGNVRELENTIERAMVLGSGNVITTEELPTHIVKDIGPPQPNEIFSTKMQEEHKLPNVVNNMERTMLEEALVQTGGHREKTAKMLGISRRALQYKLKKYDLLG